MEAILTKDGTTARAEAKASERTCVGCREVAEREELIRFAILVEDGAAAIVPDVAHKLGRRGASTHASRACIEQAVRRGGFAKSAQARVEVDAGELVSLVGAQLVARARGLLLGAIRAKLAVLGADGTEKAIAERRVVALVLATDASGRTAEIGAAMTRLGGKAIPLLTKAELGALVGRDEVAVVGIQDEGIADALGHVARQLSGVRGGNQDDSSHGRQRSDSKAG